MTAIRKNKDKVLNKYLGLRIYAAQPDAAPIEFWRDLKALFIAADIQNVEQLLAAHPKAAEILEVLPD